MVQPISYPSRADINLDAFEANLHTVRDYSTAKKLLAVVKADAYGHGRAQCARAAIRAGADYLGVAQLAEALELRQEVGVGVPILAWIYPLGTDMRLAIEADIDVSVGSFSALEAIETAAHSSSKPARIHLKVDTAMARGGFDLAELEDAAQRARGLELAGLVQVVGLWSHLARADEPDCGLTELQVERFERARALVSQAGLDVEVHHLAASAGTL